MKQKTIFQRIFGVGPLGYVVTVLIWYFTYTIERAAGFPQIAISSSFRLLLLIVFVTDAVYLIFGGLYQLIKNGWGKNLIKAGPYRLIRHPLYSAVIYSGTGALAIFFYSWAILISVLPISLFWSWMVQKEETQLINKFGDDYKSYMEISGQFLPSFKKLRKLEAEDNKRQ
ncbi:methyltransferase family protein [Candidatus Neomarinimicrobiota bacterium]